MTPAEHTLLLDKLASCYLLVNQAPDQHPLGFWDDRPSVVNHDRQKNYQLHLAWIKMAAQG